MQPPHLDSALQWSRHQFNTTSSAISSSVISSANAAACTQPHNRRIISFQPAPLPQHQAIYRSTHPGLVQSCLNYDVVAQSSGMKRLPSNKSGSKFNSAHQSGYLHLIQLEKGKSTLLAAVRGHWRLQDEGRRWSPATIGSVNRFHIHLR